MTIEEEIKYLRNNLEKSHEYISIHTLDLICELFWLITQAPGVTRYASDVRKFGITQAALHPEDAENIINTIEGYEKEEG